MGYPWLPPAVKKIIESHSNHACVCIKDRGSVVINWNGIESPWMFDVEAFVASPKPPLCPRQPINTFYYRYELDVDRYLEDDYDEENY